MPMMVNQGLEQGSDMRALILGGTGDANKLAEAFVREKIDAIYSYAGRTQIPLGHALPTRKALRISSARPASLTSSMRRILSPRK